MSKSVRLWYNQKGKASKKQRLAFHNEDENMTFGCNSKQSATSESGTAEGLIE